MQQSLSELLADTRKQQPGHQFPYPSMYERVPLCSLKQMTLAIYEALSNILRNCYNLAAPAHWQEPQKILAVREVFAAVLLLFAVRVS